MEALEVDLLAASGGGVQIVEKVISFLIIHLLPYLYIVTTAHFLLKYVQILTVSKCLARKVGNIVFPSPTFENDVTQGPDSRLLPCIH